MRAAAGVMILASWAAIARAATPAGDDIDDPKLARRLKSRTTLAVPGEAAAPVASPPTSPFASMPATPVVPTPVPVVTVSTDTARATPTATAGADLVSSGTPPAGVAATAPRDVGKTPTIGLGYRRFSFVQVGATGSGAGNGSAASEPFDSVSLDFYPISRLIRFGLSTQYGWQSGQFGGGNGDYFIAQSASLGLQAAGPVVTPFAEAFAGGGYMRRFQFDRTVPTAYWQLGLDAGASFFLGDVGYVSVALGYLHPVNGFVQETSFTSVYVDTWSLKLGIGL
jgi:hypothetical protein